MILSCEQASLGDVERQRYLLPKTIFMNVVYIHVVEGLDLVYYR